jgi:hypothetical protein
MKVRAHSNLAFALHQSWKPSFAFFCRLPFTRLIDRCGNFLLVCVQILLLNCPYLLVWDNIRIFVLRMTFILIWIVCSVCTTTLRKRFSHVHGLGFKVFSGSGNRTTVLRIFFSRPAALPFWVWARQRRCGIVRMASTNVQRRKRLLPQERSRFPCKASCSNHRQKNPNQNEPRYPENVACSRQTFVWI